MATDRDIQSSAVDAILERGVQFRLPTPRWQWPFRRSRTLVVRHLKAGTILEICRVANAAGLDDLNSFVGEAATLDKTVEACARCVAIAVLNDKERIRKETDKLTRLLLWGVTAESLFDLFAVIKSMWRVSDFLDITSWTRSWVAMMLTPRLGQDERGS